ncbi:MAG TPA: chemotaxis protein CheB [Burkholderiaceae bacterium]|nr:chemotaxis protein CheB [Burkholderiaceae bacterium]
MADDVPQAPDAYYVVGIGSSAGGLEALTQLLPALPTGLGLRYVVVQHMSPHRRSMMAQLLGRSTRMPVREAVDGEPPAPDTVLITPPNRNVQLGADGLLHLTEPPVQTGPKPSINAFFESLAGALGARAIGVVLSGTGHDGALGLRHIKSAGGFTFAQEPGEAKYEGMVRAAIEGGTVDWVLAAPTIGPEIERLARRVARTGTLGSEPAEAASLQGLLGSLYAQSGIDFSGYKEPTLLRRLERRMAATGCQGLADYVALTQRDPRELARLAEEMLISVTAFFRDAPAFERLGKELLRHVSGRPDATELRAWVAGCATGEEAYSVALLLLEAVQAAGVRRRVQVFATDIDEAALRHARRGVYPAAALESLPEELVKRYFCPHAEGMEVNKTLREVMLFARHNVVQDPPFVRLDLVSCRNLLIYLQAPIQQSVLTSFHYALMPVGLLFLGRTESVHGSDSMFEPVDRTANLYRCLGQRVRALAAGGEKGFAIEMPRRHAPDLAALLHRAAVQRFAPACVLVDGRGDVRQVHGDVSAFMALPEGRAGMGLMTLARRELRPELARLLRLVQQPPAGRAAPGSDPALGRWRANRMLSKEHAVRVSVQAVASAGEAPMYLVCFECRPLAERPVAADEPALAQTALDDELAATREHLYTVIEELEAGTEEMQSLNEEVQMANQELQSANEELEAANEELQASNEELATVNEELQVKSTELQHALSALEGLWSALDVPMLAFSRHDVLEKLNGPARQQLRLGDENIGRPLHRIDWPAQMPSLANDFDLAQRGGQTVLRQIQGMGGRHWSVRVMPRPGLEEGVLLQLLDNTRLREAELGAERSHARLQQVVERSGHLMCLCDVAGRVLMANRAFAQLHGFEAIAAVGQPLAALLQAGEVEAFRASQLEAVRRLEPVAVEETLRRNAENVHLLATHFPLIDADGAVSSVCYQALDVTERRRAARELEAARTATLEAEAAASNKSRFLATMSHEIRTPMNAIIGLSRLARDARSQPEMRDHMAKAHGAALALMRILDDVLDYSKIEAGALQFEHRPFRLHEVLLRVRELFAANAEHKGLVLAVEMPQDLPASLVGDPMRLSQVLNNLVGNAIKFTEHGEVHVSVAHSPDVSGGCMLRFAVRDTGMGVAPELREALFVPFSQGDGSVTRRFGGTGLGLAISRCLVELMGGRIGYDSTPGQGSTFWFTACLDEPAAGPAPAQPALAPAAVSPERLRGRRVLLAEDNKLNQLVGRGLLESLGLDVQLADDGEQAVAAVKAHPPGHFLAVLMDVHMPGVDGLEATRRLRTLPQGHCLPILAVTAAVLSEDRRRCLSAGMDLHLPKPLMTDALRGALLDCLDGVAGMKTSWAARQPLPAEPELRIPGFDAPALLARLGGSTATMNRVLRQFKAEVAAIGPEIARHIAAGQHDAARASVHALVGAAASAGAVWVERSAAGLEAALDLGGPTEAVHQALQDALAAAAAALRRVPGADAAPDEARQPAEALSTR